MNGQRRFLNTCCRAPAPTPRCGWIRKSRHHRRGADSGATYLPRKFKTTVVIPPQNDVDLHANDLNFVAISDNNQLVGFNVLVGGGLSIAHGDKATYPRTASELGYIPLAHTLAVAEAVVTTQRDWGNRTNRKNAKTKYTLERVGVETFKQEVERRAGITFEPVRPYVFTGRGDRIGWVKGSIINGT